MNSAVFRLPNKRLFSPKTLELNFLQRFSSKSSSSSSDSSDSDSDDKKPKSNVEKLNKLNELLMKIIEQDKVATGSKLNLAQPADKRASKANKDESQDKAEPEEVRLAKAAQDVAKEVGGDVKKTELELLSKLLHSSGISGEPSAPTTKNLADIVKGMKIDRETPNVEQSRAEQVRQMLRNVQSRLKGDQQSPPKRARRTFVPQMKQERIETIDLFGGPPLGIFTNKSDLKDVPLNKTWNALYERDLKLAVTHPPANHFQQAILWTEQGKLWKFPIDNEQGLDEEKEVNFTQHVFLEEHLEPWCPPKGPLRHFMELVCVGLSKNPYLTVDAKREHIEWYKGYFDEKKGLLQEVGLVPAEPAELKSKEIE